MLLLLVHVFFCMLLLRCMKWFRQFDLPFYVWPLILLIKVLIGFFMAQYYMDRYQGGDMHAYLHDAAAFQGLYQSSPIDFWKIISGCYTEGESFGGFFTGLKIWFDSGFGDSFNDARTVVRFHAVLGLVSGQNEWVHLLWSNFLSMVGVVALIHFAAGGKVQKSWLPLLVFFIPNVLIWSSLILKESLLLFALGGSLVSFSRLRQEISVRNAMVLFFFLICFLLVKSFWLMLLLPAFAYGLVVRKENQKVVGLLFTYLAIAVFVLILGTIFPFFDVPAQLYAQQRNMWKFAVYMHAGSLMEPVGFAPSPWSLIRHFPDAFYKGCMTPLPSGQPGLFAAMLVAENFLLPFLLVRYLLRRKQVLVEPAFPLVVCVLLGVGIVLISAFTTPVLGSLIRYRMPGMLCLIVSLVLVNANRLQSK